jgi:hypothetical protein
MPDERPLDRDVVERWLDAHDEAWRSADAAAIADLFGEDAIYHLGPWDAPWRGLSGPFRGRDAIAAGWLAGGIESERFVVESEILAIEGLRAVVRRRITYLEPDASVESAYDTCWVIDFDRDGRCAEYQEWFVEAPSDRG